MPLSKTPYFMLSTGSNKETRPDITEKVLTGTQRIPSNKLRDDAVQRENGF